MEEWCHKLEQRQWAMQYSLLRQLDSHQVATRDTGHCTLDTEHNKAQQSTTEKLFCGSLPSEAVTQAETRALVAQSGGVDELRKKVDTSLAQSRSSVTVS